MLRRKAERLFDLVGIDVIRPVVVGRRRDNVDRSLLREFLLDDLFDHMGNFHDGHVLVAAVEDLVGDLLRRSDQQQLAEIGIVLNVQIWAQLRAAEHRDLVVRYGVVGQDIDRQIEPQARCVTAHGRRPEDDADEADHRCASSSSGSHMPLYLL